MELHQLPQDYTSSGRSVETKLSKPQQIDAITDKNVQDMITLEVDFRVWILAWGVESYFLGDQISVVALGFIPGTRLNPID